MRFFDTMETSVGILRIEENNGYITRIGIFEPGQNNDAMPHVVHPLITQCKQQLQEYFSGERAEFTVPIRPFGTDYSQSVWEKLKTVNYGETITYKELATRMGTPTAQRAVAGANRRNPIMIILPCHRVIGANGAMTGYAGGGIKNKEWLIEHEKKHREKLLPLK